MEPLTTRVREAINPIQPMPTPPMPTHPPTWLPPIPGLARRDPDHVYELDGVTFPISVTGVLSVLKSDTALERIEATREVWAPRGNAAHRALELFLLISYGRGGDMAALADLFQGPYADWVQPLITHDRWDQIEVIASERPTCCLRRRVAGTFDLAYLDEQGRRILADLKSLGSESSSTYSTAAQLGGYMACEATWGNTYDAGQTIWCRPGSTTFSPLYSVQECRLAWAGAWAAWRARPPTPF